MMNKIEYLLNCVQEECAEISKVASKANRFGLEHKPPDGHRDTTNTEEIVAEFCDLLCVMEYLVEVGAIKALNYDEMKSKTSVKRKKLDEFMEYSRKLGTLEPET